MAEALITLLDEAVNRCRNAEIARQQQAYMRGLFPFAGIKAPVRKAIQKDWFKRVRETAPELKWELAKALWEKPEREYQHVATDWISTWKKQQWDAADGRELEHLIVTKSWWDTVDSLAANGTGTWLKQFPEKKEATIGAWRHSENLWLNRTCLIFQLRYKNDVDFELLRSLIEQYRDEKEFFIRKAIGWSLRQYSKFNPEAVSDFIDSVRLSGLARREASKYL